MRKSASLSREQLSSYKDAPRLSLGYLRSMVLVFMMKMGPPTPLLTNFWYERDCGHPSAVCHREMEGRLAAGQGEEARKHALS